MEKEPAASDAPDDDSTPPEAESEEPVAAVPTNETTPVWAHTQPVAPAEDPVDAPAAATDDADGSLSPASEMDRGATPDWSRTESSSNGEAKKTPQWAETVPTSPGESIAEEEKEEDQKAAAARAEHVAEPAPAKPAEPDVWASEPPPAQVTPAPLHEPPRAMATDALKSSWPPRADAGPAPPEETDIWPPEPPTERAMPAWPPPSEMEEPATPAQAIPSWPDSFDAPSAAAAAPAPAAPAPPAPKSAATPSPAPPPPKAAAPALSTPASGPVPPHAATPPAEPATIPPAQESHPAPVAPSHPGPVMRPSWAPGRTSETPAAAASQTSAPAHMEVPAWAPRVPLASEPGTPTWFSPKEQIPHATGQTVVPKAQPPPEPAGPVVGGQLPVAHVPAAPAAPAAPAQPAASKPAWQVVEQARPAKGHVGPTAEDRSYAEWFAWAKRGGAPASACHAAAQGAFKALSSGKDVQTAVQWATAAMSRPPENVTYARQSYCAWFALANIDLNLDQHRAHAFAGAAVQALDAGQDASAAHAAGLVAAGIR